MIPKKIHYHWYGGGKLLELEERCLASWHDKLPDFEIIQWDEKNFMLEDHPFTQQACEAGKWAFVSDYARLWSLYHYGGVYLDTDYEIVGSLAEYMEKDMFIGV